MNPATELLKQKPEDERQVVFVDEMPWMDTPRSNFVTAFEYFWNEWASGQDNIMFIACGTKIDDIQFFL